MKQGDQLFGSVSRRGFMTRLGLGGAGVAASACTQRVPRFIVPYLVPPDDVVPGVLTAYRSVCRGCPAGCGVTALVMNGRAIKLEGNPDHPVSGGALCLAGQAGIETLYSPDRLTGPFATTAGGDVAPLEWAAAGTRFADGLRQALDRGSEIAILTRPEGGALHDLMTQWLAGLGQPSDNIVVFDPAEPIWLREAARLTFGIDAQPVWALGEARTVLSIGADLLEDYGSPVEYAREIAKIRADRARRFFYAGPRLSLTAASATRRVPLQPGREMGFVLALLGEVLTLTDGQASLPADVRDHLRQLLAEPSRAAAARDCGVPSAQVHELAEALVTAGPGLVAGPGRIAAGEDALAVAQAVALLNAAIGAVGTTLRFAEPTRPGMSVEELVGRIEAGKVGALVVHHADPLGLAPIHDSLGRALARIPFVAVIGCQLDDTARRAHLVLADHHYLESWGEVTPRAGVRGSQQPAMTPLHDTRAAADVLLDVARALGKSQGLPYGGFADVMQERFDEDTRGRGGEFAAPTPTAASLAPGALDRVAMWTPMPAATGQGPILLATPSLRHPGGIRMASPLVQEVPDTLTAVAWSGCAELPPDLARAHSLDTGDEVQVATAAGSVRLPVVVMPGIDSGVVAVALPDATALLGPRGSMHGRVGPVRLTATGRRLLLPQVSRSLDQQGRHLAREVPDALDVPAVTDVPPPTTGRRRWAMAVDLDRCNGCGACVAACYVENNSPVVGPEEVARGRDMAWLRIHRYFAGPPDRPHAVFLPVMCQQCTDAPCETVCPAYATYHTKEGLNAQVYNRCIGTRFCENNCPYSVRRFNWFDWPRPAPASEGLNPSVTVRSRGVTEKCTFCIQRIRRAEEQAKLETRPLGPGEIVPACVQTCPAEALVFGDLDDPRSRVAELARSGRAYHLLEELNTGPGVVYLARHGERA